MRHIGGLLLRIDGLRESNSFASSSSGYCARSLVENLVIAYGRKSSWHSAAGQSQALLHAELNTHEHMVCRCHSPLSVIEPLKV